MWGGDTEPPTLLQRLPTFWQLDVRVDRTWQRDTTNVTLFFDLQNVTNHRNIEYRGSYPDMNNVYRHENVRGLPIIPYVGVEISPH